jgi:hypothetical protein
MRFVLPVAVSDRREGALSIDGSLEDWTGADAIHNGPLLRMFNRPALQKQELEFATNPSALYTGWSAEQFYLAFNLSGISADARGGGAGGARSKNFVDYQFRRAWGEDLCEILIQGVYIDNTLGPVTHLVCKPSGQLWLERKTPPPITAWESFEGGAVRYGATVDTGVWRGELAIPWGTLISPGRGVPSLIRFNFSQHHHASGESASWAGPIDHGRDDAFMGLLHLREPSTPGAR